MLFSICLAKRQKVDMVYAQNHSYRTPNSVKSSFSGDNAVSGNERAITMAKLIQSYLYIFSNNGGQ